MKPWRHLFRSVILERGIKYHDHHKIIDITKEKNCYHAVVEGEHKYEVRVLLRGDKILDAYCDCPYYIQGELCKHIAATLIKVEELEDK